MHDRIYLIGDAAAQEKFRRAYGMDSFTAAEPQWNEGSYAPGRPGPGKPPRRQIRDIRQPAAGTDTQRVRNALFCQTRGLLPDILRSGRGFTSCVIFRGCFQIR